MATVFFRLLANDDKPAALAQAVDRLRDGEPSPDGHIVDPESFRQVPGSPFAYWVSEKVRRLFTDVASFEGEGRTAHVGLQTNDDFHWLRLVWEVPINAIGEINKNRHSRSWIPFSKGGSFSRYYSEIHLVVDWTNEGGTLKAWKQKELSLGRITANNSKCWNESLYFASGLTWSRRSQVGLSLRVLPRDCIFSDKGPTAFSPESIRLKLLGLANSSAFHSFVLLQMAFGSYETGVIQRTPVPDLDRTDADPLNKLVAESIDLQQSLDRANETSHVFHLPGLLQVSGKTFADRIAACQSHVAETDRRLAENQREIDDIAFRLYGIDGEDRRAMEEGSGLITEPAEDIEAEDDE
jgi:hypothetical protein